MACRACSTPIAHRGGLLQRTKEPHGRQQHGPFKRHRAESISERVARSAALTFGQQRDQFRHQRVRVAFLAGGFQRVFDGLRHRVVGMRVDGHLVVVAQIFERVAHRKPQARGVASRQGGLLQKSRRSVPSGPTPRKVHRQRGLGLGPTRSPRHPLPKAEASEPS